MGMFIPDQMGLKLVVAAQQYVRFVQENWQ